MRPFAIMAFLAVPLSANAQAISRDAPSLDELQRQIDEAKAAAHRAKKGHIAGQRSPTNHVAAQNQTPTDELEKSGHVTRGFIGVRAQAVNAAMAKALRLPAGESDDRGAVVVSVESDSPAQKAGVQPGDVIIAVDSHHIGNARELAINVSQIPPGTDARLTVVRNGSTTSIPVTIGTLSADQASGRDEASTTVFLRSEIGRPLLQARAYLQDQNFGMAMKQVSLADSATGKTDREQAVIEQMRAAIAQQSGDLATAIRSEKYLIDSGAVAGASALPLMESEASYAFTNKSYLDVVYWAKRYFQSGGTATTMRSLLIESYYLLGNYGEAARLQTSQIEEETSAGRVPSEAQLTMLYRCQEKIGDISGQLDTVRQLITNYPKPLYNQVQAALQKQKR